ncbi:unnamed protein product [Parnassius apollo]|uniref:(apollo) hypothetical protein n=1 Tax=Parnassius apollo TaxID=110799 RepID=A0A8S3Y8G8_PARAO|nr:unnamed protein product [Parnassius apollo]
MIGKVYYSVIIINILQVCAIFSLTGRKSSLTFVIEDTNSMQLEINGVLNSAYKIFDVVYDSNASVIENVIIVMFNDPVTIVRKDTIDRDVFKKSLKSITVHDGGDCPELAMSGIELALKASRPGSYVYVFTDAVANDYAKFEKVVNVVDPKPGVHSVEVGSLSDTAVTVLCTTNVDFQYGFSTIKPSSRNDTTNQPIPARKNISDDKFQSELYKTGYGTFCPKTTAVDEKVVALLPPQFKPLSNDFDSSAPYYTIDIVETQQLNDTQDSSQKVLGAKEDSVHQLQVKGSKRRISPLLVSDITPKKKICLTETKKKNINSISASIIKRKNQKQMNEDIITTEKLEILQVQLQNEHIMKLEKNKISLDLDIELKRNLLENSKTYLELKKNLLENSKMDLELKKKNFNL